MVTLKVLLVEDDRMIANAIHSLLESKGYEVAMFNDGQAALNDWKLFRPDLIITDMVMPEVDGIKLIANIREQNSAIPVLAMSGMGPEHGQLYLRLAEKIGANQILRKPFSSSQLMAAIHRLLPHARPD